MTGTGKGGAKKSGTAANRPKPAIEDAADSTRARVRMHFSDPESLRIVHDPIHRDLSALTARGEALFVACDETAGVDRLTPVDGGYGNHEHFNLGDILDLPGGPEGEMDIEGLEVDADWLWVVGSQSLTRDKGDIGDLTDIDFDTNRQFLGRVPLVEGEGGPMPVAVDGTRSASALKFRKRGSLRKWFRKDPLIGPFVDIPSKENGLDVEGMVASGDRIWIGLRGPVLREWAVIVEMEMKLPKKGRLKPRRIDGKRRYRMHLIPAGGQGIRDLERDGDDILVLTGPVTAGDGASAILRWTDALSCMDSGQRAVQKVVDIPYKGPVDHAEGLLKRPDGRFLLVYDSPAPDRVSDDPPWVEGDMVELK